MLQPPCNAAHHCHVVLQLGNTCQDHKICVPRQHCICLAAACVSRACTCLAAACVSMACTCQGPGIQAMCTASAVAQ